MAGWRRPIDQTPFVVKFCCACLRSSVTGGAWASNVGSGSVRNRDAGVAGSGYKEPCILRILIEEAGLDNEDDALAEKGKDAIDDPAALAWQVSSVTNSVLKGEPALHTLVDGTGEVGEDALVTEAVRFANHTFASQQDGVREAVPSARWPSAPQRPASQRSAVRRRQQRHPSAPARREERDQSAMTSSVRI
jgi:hypothetical protein